MTQTNRKHTKPAMQKKKKKPPTDPAWDGVRESISKGELVHGFGRTSIAGAFTIEAVLWSMPMPLGVLWYRIVNHETIDILNVFVFEKIQRAGIASFLLHKLIEAYPDVDKVISAAGTESGAVWMGSLGFRKCAKGHWSLKVVRCR